MNKIIILFFFLSSFVFSEEIENDNYTKSLINRFGLEYRLSFPEIHNVGLRYELSEQVYLTAFTGGFWFSNTKKNKIQNPILNFSLEGTYYAKEFLKLDEYGRSFISCQFTKYKSTGHAVIVKSEFNYYTFRVGYEFDISNSFRINFKYGISYSDFNGVEEDEDNESGVYSLEYVPIGFEYKSIGISIIYDF